MLNPISISRDLYLFFCCRGIEGIKTAINLGLTCKKNYKCISKPTFWQALISRIGGEALFTRYMHEIPRSGLTFNFPLQKGWVQNRPTLKMRQVDEIRYNKIFYVNTIEGAGIREILECNTGRFKILLEGDPKPKQFDVPESEIEPNLDNYRDFIFVVAGSRDVVVVSLRSSSVIYLFSSKTCEYLRKIKLERTAIQIHITEKNLFVREYKLVEEWISVFDIDSGLKINQIQLGGSSVQKLSICFGKTHFIHSREKNIHYSFKIYSMKKLVENSGCARVGEYLQKKACGYNIYPHVFSEDEHFIILNPVQEGIKIEKIKIDDERICAELVWEKIPLKNAENDFYIKTCYYFAGRIFAATSGYLHCDNDFPSYHMISYDLKTKNQQEFIVEGREKFEDIFPPKFSCSYKENVIKVHFASVEYFLGSKKKFFSTLEYQNK